MTSTPNHPLTRRSVATTAGVMHGIVVALVGSGLFYWGFVATWLSGAYLAPVRFLHVCYGSRPCGWCR